MNTKTKINDTTWAVTWENEYGEFCGEFFSTEIEADNGLAELNEAIDSFFGSWSRPGERGQGLVVIVVAIAIVALVAILGGGGLAGLLALITGGNGCGVVAC